jgi:hypothetical protein
MFVAETLIAPGFAGSPPPESMYSRISAAPVLQVPDTVETLILDLLEWIGPNPRPYGEVLEAWRTSCPRLPVWEDANDRGFIRRHHAPGHGALVSVSAAGAEHLRRHRQPSPR